MCFSNASQKRLSGQGSQVTGAHRCVQLASEDGRDRERRMRVRFELASCRNKVPDREVGRCNEDLPGSFFVARICAGPQRSISFSSEPFQHRHYLPDRARLRNRPARSRSRIGIFPPPASSTCVSLFGKLVIIPSTPAAANLRITNLLLTVKTKIGTSRRCNASIIRGVARPNGNAASLARDCSSARMTDLTPIVAG